MQAPLGAAGKAEGGRDVVPINDPSELHDVGTLAQITRLQAGKTGALIRWSAEAGAVKKNGARGCARASLLAGPARPPARAPAASLDRALALEPAGGGARPGVSSYGL